MKWFSQSRAIYYSGGDPVWISVKNGLPADGKHVLVFDKTEGVCCGYLRDDYWHHHPFGEGVSCDLLFSVTHWMPLPNDPEIE